MTLHPTLGNVLRDRGSQPFAPTDVARSVLLADDGLYEAVVVQHGPDVLHRLGVWRLLGHPTWTEQTVPVATALRGLLGTVRHPLARAAIAALSEGIALARLTGSDAAPGQDDGEPSVPGRHAA